MYCHKTRHKRIVEALNAIGYKIVSNRLYKRYIVKTGAYHDKR